MANAPDHADPGKIPEIKVNSKPVQLYTSLVQGWVKIK